MEARYGYVGAGDGPPVCAAVARVQRTLHVRRAWLTILVALIACLAMPVATSIAGQGLHDDPTVYAAHRSLSLQAALSRLPSAARGPVAAVLGRDDPLSRVAGLSAASPAQPFGASLPAGEVAFSSGYSSYIPQGPALTPSGEEGAGLFGYSVALSANGDTALIGGPGDDEGRGAAWVFTRLDGVWTQQGPKLTGGSEEVGKGWFGASVALSHYGETALVGGLKDDEERGAAWMFTHSGTTWSQQGPKLTGEGAAPEAWFGASVALSASGSMALIGEPGDDAGRGSTWRFTRSSEGTWAPYGTRLTAPEEIGDGLFGTSVAFVELSSVTALALIGGPGDDDGVGAAWIAVCYSENFGSECVVKQKLIGQDAIGKAEMGASVALSVNGGDLALIGGPGDSGEEGSAWVFGGPPAEKWEQQSPKLTVSGSKQFGASVGLSTDGQTAIISGTGKESGVWRFSRSGIAWTNTGELIGGSAEVALSFDAETVLLGEDTSNNEVGSAGVLVLPALEHEPTYESQHPYRPPLRAPGEPTNVKAVAGDGQATVSFTPPTDIGSSPITSYIVASRPGGTEVSGTGSPIVVKGLTNATAYRFEVTAVNAAGAGSWSDSSEEVIPLNPASGLFVLGQQKSGRGGALSMSIYVSRPGTLQAQQQASVVKTTTKGAKKNSSKRGKKASSARAKHKHRVPTGTTALVQSAHTSAKGAGIVTLVLKPTKAARQTLSAHRPVKIPLLLTFSSPGGVPSSQETTVELGGKGSPSSFPADGPPQPSQRYSFADGLAGWEPAWGNMTIADSPSQKFSGAQSLQITMHTEPYSAVDATFESSSTALFPLKLGSVIYMWVYRPASTPAGVSVVPMVREGSAWTFCPGPAVKPPASVWYQISMAVANCTGSTTATDPEVRAVGVQVDDPGGAANGQSIYLDQVSW